jgi:hypothetical protein
MFECSIFRAIKDAWNKNMHFGLVDVNSFHTIQQHVSAIWDHLQGGENKNMDIIKTCINHLTV